jgi:hypothetical protein
MIANHMGNDVVVAVPQNRNVARLYEPLRLAHNVVPIGGLAICTILHSVKEKFRLLIPKS